MLATVTILLAAAILAVLAVGVAYVLGWANRTFHVAVDPKVEAALDVLPNANCGACGFVGCSEYAEAIARGDAEVTLCAPGGAGCAQRLAEILGVTVEESYPYRAVVHCAAHYDDRLLRTHYSGEATCASANLVAGVQGCTYGCLGFGDCTRACKYDAIHIIDGLATVDYHKCIGCKACARACPRNIISMVPFKQERMFVVACSNQDKGPEVQAVCTVGCIGCTSCTRRAELMQMQGNLPVVDYERYEGNDHFEPALAKCPRASMIYVGKPSPADLVAVADEQLPDRVEADFKTTVDETEWRG
ncbi:MAG: RnfABCDGE type electron transport complex subunit B [Thermoguttaceae bacterium]|jgi:RnfABCDGE-type electron transport complex B subunit|nr:RnfABCDGE type electron transport complex subunit B [Thermoguttaceae bacterium]